MELITADLKKRLPQLYATEQQGMKALALVHYFTPDSSWDWYATEFDGHDIFFGLVKGDFLELGYFSLSELKAARGKLGLPIERDLYWQPKTLQQIEDMWHSRGCI
jgi:hypothetical protein